MKIYIIILSLFLYSCCAIPSYKCNLERGQSKFKITDISTGADLIFGPTRIYNKDSIKFYSLNGRDTISHFVFVGINNYLNQDSILYVGFDYSDRDTVFVKLSNSVTDKLILKYEVVNDSRCCSGYSGITSYTYNGVALSTSTGGIIIIKK